MKHSLLIFSFLLPSFLFSQNFDSDTLKGNEVKIAINSRGEINNFHFKDYPNKNLVYSNGFLVSDADNNGNVRAAIDYYSSDFIPGPPSTRPNKFAFFNKVYPITKSQIDSFLQGLYTTIPTAIADWPAHGNPSFGEPQNMAPFVDVNMDGLYDPTVGDYPKFSGDQAVFFMMNDDTTHHWGSPPFKIFVKGLAYSFNQAGPLDSTVFVNYSVTNLAQQDYLDVYFSNLLDFDIGNPNDDILGTDIYTHSVYGYNADSLDEGPLGYGTNPPVVGVMCMKGITPDLYDGLDNDFDGCADGIMGPNGICIPEDSINNIREQILMSSSMYHLNVLGNTGYPSSLSDFRNQQKNLWKDGSHLGAETPSGPYNTNNGDGYNPGGGLFDINFAFPGESFDSTANNNPTVNTNWFSSPTNASDDPKILMTSGPFTFYSGETKEFEIAITSQHRPNKNGPQIDQILARLNNLYGRSDSILNLFNTIGLQESNEVLPWSVYPNPSDKEVVIENRSSQSFSIYLFNTQGVLLEEKRIEGNSTTQINTQSLPNGVYFLYNEYRDFKKIVVIH